MIKFFIWVVLALVLGFAIIAGVWWIILWSFNFPIVFSFKQVIGVMLITGLVNSGSARGSNDG